METKVGGERAREISDHLPFDGGIHMDTIEYVGGLWMLWNLDKVEVNLLSNIKQEIHAIAKVRNSNSSWLISTIYASPRSAERRILWNNLNKVAELHELPWVIVGDSMKLCQLRISLGVGLLGLVAPYCSRSAWITAT